MKGEKAKVRVFNGKALILIVLQLHVLVLFRKRRDETMWEHAESFNKRLESFELKMPTIGKNLIKSSCFICSIIFVKKHKSKNRNEGRILF